MGDSKTKNSLRNAITGLLLRLIGILMPFVIRTIIIKKIGMEYAGLNTLFASILQVLSLTELGFSATVAFCLYKPIENRDKEVINALLNFLKKVYTIIGIIILLIGVVLIPFIPYLIKGDYPADINIYILFIIYLFNTVISYFLFSYKSVLLASSQRNDIENNIATFASLFMYVAQIIVLFIFKNYYIYIIFLPISTLIINVLRNYICNRIFPEYRPMGNISLELRHDISKRIKAMIGHRLSYTIVTSVDNIFISAFLGLVLLAKFQNYFYIVTALLGIITIFHVSISASIGNSMAFQTKDYNYDIFKKMTFINIWLVGWMSICLMCLFQHFIKIWVGEENMLPLLTVILMVIYFYAWRFKDIVCVYKDAAGMWNADFFKPYAVSIANIILNLILINFIGVNGVLIATIISVPIISLPWETKVLFRDYFEKSPKYYYIKIFIYTLSLLVIGILTYMICELLPNDGILFLLVKMIICAIVPNVLFILFYFKTDEFKWILSKAKSILKKNI